TLSIVQMHLDAAPTVSGATMVWCRQFCIFDYADITLGAIPNGVFFRAVEHAMASCTGPVKIVGDIPYFALLESFVKINLGCEINLPSPPTFSVFIAGDKHIEVNAYYATYTGAGAGTGSAGIQFRLPTGSLVPSSIPFPGSIPGAFF